MRGLSVAGILIAFFYFSCNPAYAQQSGEDVGAQSERFRKGIEEKRQQTEEKAVKPAEIEFREKKEEAPEGGPSFVLKEVMVTGSTIFRPDDLVSAYEPYLAKEVRFKDLEVIADKIKARYKEQGFFTTTAYVPQQDIKDGKVEIRIVEGKMGALIFEGNKWFSSAVIEKFFHSKKNGFLNVKILQRDLLRLNLNPDLNIKAVISAGKEPETSDITLKAQESFSDHAGFGVDNQGSRLVGKYRPMYFVRSSNATGRLDSFYLSYLFSSSSSGESLSYAIPVGTYGTKFALDIAYFETKLGKEFTDLDITGTTQSCVPHVIWELALSDTYQASADLGLEIKAVKKQIGENVTSNDQMRLPYVSFNFAKSDAWGGGGQTVFNPRITFSTENFLGASSRNHPTASRANTGGFFAKYEQELQRIQRMPFGTYVSLKTHFQLASHTLASSEQLQIGGANSIRGYPEGEYLADSGGYMNFEWFFPAYFIPERWKLPNAKLSLRHQIEPVFFVDAGKGELKKVLSGEKKDRFLAGIGGGFRIRLNDNFYLRLEWASRIGNRPAGNSGPSTFHMAFQYDI